jgi:hypothetical protein
VRPGDVSVADDVLNRVSLPEDMGQRNELAVLHRLEGHAVAALEFNAD